MGVTAKSIRVEILELYRSGSCFMDRIRDTLGAYDIRRKPPDAAPGGAGVLMQNSGQPISGGYVGPSGGAHVPLGGSASASAAFGASPSAASGSSASSGSSSAASGTSAPGAAVADFHNWFIISRHHHQSPWVVFAPRLPQVAHPMELLLPLAFTQRRALRPAA